MSQNMQSPSMQWEKLISYKRFGLEDENKTKMENYMNFQYDYNRILLSASFRRLQNKRQVFPPIGNIIIHNRLLHSLEVSCVGRMLAIEVCDKLVDKYKNESWKDLFYSLPSIISAACLAHDIGNPPFGHPGESAIASYFSEGNGQQYKEHLSEVEWNDLIHFDGNANTFRLLTHTFNGKHKGGFTLTYSTLATIVKYPYESSFATRNKYGFMHFEKAYFREIMDDLGIIKLSESPLIYVRHPLTYLMEAADDISYLLTDLDDAVKLGILSHQEAYSFLLDFLDEEEKKTILDEIQNIEDPNERLEILRSYVVGFYVKEVARVFIENEEKILKGELEGCLIDLFSPVLKNACNSCRKMEEERVYPARCRSGIDLSGYKIINTLADILINAVNNPDTLYSQYVMEMIPSQYETQSPTLYGRILACVDFISGMTDVFAFDFYNKVSGRNISAL